MMNYPETFGWLRSNKIQVYGKTSDNYDGFLFRSEPVALDGIWGSQGSKSAKFLLNPISKRLDDRSILDAACQIGAETQKSGNDFHPAVNRALNESTKGRSALMQVGALTENIRWVMRNVV